MQFRFLVPLVVAALASASARAQSLDTTIADALAHAPALAEAAAGESAARARLDRARAEGNPLLRVEGSYGAGRIDNDRFFGITAGNVSPLALQAIAEMPLFAGGRVAAAMDQARGGAQMAQLGVEQARLQTVNLAVSSHVGVLTARTLEARHAALVAALDETERQAVLRYRAGEIASSELAQARARRAEAQAGLVQAQGGRAAAEAAYVRMTGKPAGDLAAPALPAVLPSLGDALDRARAANPMLRQAQAGLDVARAGVRSARAEAMPAIGAYAEAARVRDQFFPGYRADTVAVGLRGRWTLWAGGRVAAQSRVADAEWRASEARLRAADQALEAMVIDAWQALETARLTTDASRLRAQAATEALRGIRLEAKVGAKPMLAVLDAQRDAIEADAALLQAESLAIVAAWRLNALTGRVASAPASDQSRGE